MASAWRSWSHSALRFVQAPGASRLACTGELMPAIRRHMTQIDVAVERTADALFAPDARMG